MKSHDQILAECKERLVIAKVYLTFNQPFYAALVNRMDLVPTIKIDTLATDGSHIFYNPYYIMGIEYAGTIEYKKRKSHTTRQKKHIDDGGLTDLQLVGGIVHEVLHCAFKHFTRRDGRNHEVWNIACDFAINQIIARDGVGKIHPAWLLDPKYDRMTAEQIYDSLMKEHKSDVKKIVNKYGTSIDNHIDPDFEKKISHDGTEDDTEISNELIDEMLINDGISPAGNNIRVKMEDVALVAGSMASMKGCPETLRNLMVQIHEPVIDWRRRIMKTMLSHLSTDYWWKRPNKRTLRTRYKFPSRKPEQKIDICVALDMSGSITDQMRNDFISELVGIVKQHRHYRIRIMCFDTKVMNEQVFDSTSSDLADLAEYKCVGGGGTDFMCVWEHLKSIKHVPEHLFMFTDGYPGGSWGLPKYCNTTFLITTKKVPPFGNHIPYKKDAKYRKKFGI